MNYIDDCVLFNEYQLLYHTERIIELIKLEEKPKVSVQFINLN